MAEQKINDATGVTALRKASDMLSAAMQLAEHSDNEIDAALRLLGSSNPGVVYWLLYTLPSIFNASE